MVPGPVFLHAVREEGLEGWFLALRPAAVFFVLSETSQGQTFFSWLENSQVKTAEGSSPVVELKAIFCPFHDSMAHVDMDQWHALSITPLRSCLGLAVKS